MIRYVTVVLLLCISLFGATHSKVKYSPFIDAQIELTYEMNDANLSQEKASELVQKQEEMYDDQLYRLMADKEYYLKHLRDYNSEIFSLKKIISINKRAGNTYAVIRDEVQIKSYTIVQNINLMVKSTLLALDSSKTIDEFEVKLNKITAKNQKQLSLIVKGSDYSTILALRSESKVIKAAQHNIKEFYALQDVNSDMIAHLFKFSNKMYRLNKYSKFHLIKPVVFVNSLDPVQMVDKLLEPVGLSVIKVLIILFLILVIYVLRKLFYIVFEKYLINSDFLSDYAEDILLRTQKSIEVLIIMINVNMVVYVYNNFSSVEYTTKFFNVVYTMIITYIFYIVVNTIAAHNLEKFSKDKSTTVKGDLINVGIKIINFFIFTIGIIIILYFAGVNLTALLSGLGIGGFAVAFAAKDTISNFFGTLSILFSDVFSQGDWIEIDGREGTVVEIGLRVTTIRTFDNALIAIPNGTFASKDIKNWNKRKIGRRIKMKLGVKYDSKREDIKNAIVEIREMLQNHPDIATQNTKYEHIMQKRGRVAKIVSKDDLEGIKRTLLVYLDEFSDSSINILIYCFSKSVDWEEWLKTKQDVMERMMEILERNNLEFAFPSLSIYDETKKIENS